MDVDEVSVRGRRKVVPVGAGLVERVGELAGDHRAKRAVRAL